MNESQSPRLQPPREFSRPSLIVHQGIESPLD